MFSKSFGTITSQMMILAFGRFSRLGYAGAALILCLSLEAHSFDIKSAQLAPKKAHSAVAATRSITSDSSTTSHDDTRRDAMAKMLKIALIPSASCQAFSINTIGASAEVAAPLYGASPDRPVAILGGGGRTGMEVAQALAAEGMYCVTMTRTGRDPFQVIKLPPSTKQYVAHYAGPVDVTNKVVMNEALSNDKFKASAVVFCASASKQGGSATHVDDEGVGYAAEISKLLNARLVVVSALAVDRPESKSFQITNTLGGNLNGIMDAKRRGEEKVRSIMSDNPNYVIVRPGVLLSGKTTKGPEGMQVNQGDTIGGGLSRDELAGVVVGALKSSAKGATVEAYRAATATALQPEFRLPSGRESSPSKSYQDLFKNVS